MDAITPKESEIDTINKLLSTSNDNNQQIINKLQMFVNLVINENQKHNLIGESTVEKIWTRHIIDSLQLIKYCNDNICQNIVDLGSGAGFPAIVLAIATKKNIFMIEKSPVKAKVLNSVVRMLQIANTKIINQHIDKNNAIFIFPENTYITSRAFKSTGEILDIVNDNINVKKIILLKGQNFRQEIDKLPSPLKRKFKIEICKSINQGGVIIKVNKRQ